MLTEAINRSDYEEIDVAVIGAGIIGLAVAREFSLDDREVVVLEQETSIGQHSSSRNSEVIHSGLYYEPGSLKAKLCVQGKQTLYEYSEDNGIKHKKLGKVVVATRDEEVPVLQELKAKGDANGVRDLELLD